MNLSRIRTIGWVSLLMVLAVFAPTISADDDGKKHQRRERKHNENNHSGYRGLKPVSNSTYADHCGACHFTYQPELLPAVSWKRILDGTDDHFGETLDLDEDARREISGYLASNAADKSSARLAGKIMSCLGGRYLSESPTFLVFAKSITNSHPSDRVPQIGSLANCTTCHSTAGEGDYDDEHMAHSTLTGRRQHIVRSAPHIQWNKKHGCHEANWKIPHRSGSIFFRKNSRICNMGGIACRADGY